MCLWGRSHLLLPRESRLAQVVPAAIELAFVFLNPFLGCVMGCVSGPGCVIDEERLLGRHRLLEFHPFDRFGRHVGGEVVVVLFLFRNARYPVKDHWLPLVCFPSNEAIELVETRVGWPAEVGTRNRDLPGRRLVPFPKSCRAVSVVAKRLGKVLRIVGTHAQVSGKAGGNLHHRSHIHVVMIAS